MRPPSLKPIRAVTFDLDDTLWDNRPVLEAAEQALHDWLARHYPEVTEHFDIAGLRSLRQQVAQANPHLRHDLSSVRKLSLALAARRCGYGESLAEQAFEVFLEARHRVSLYGDVEPCLQALLDAGLLLASLTNGNADPARLGLGGYFHFSLSAGQVGAAKPHPRIYLAACELAGVQPQELVHVGDEPQADVGGAIGAGAWAVWMNRSGQAWPGGASPHAEVKNMHGLLEVVSRWTACP